MGGEVFRTAGQGLNWLGSRTDNTILAGLAYSGANAANLVAAAAAPAAYVEVYQQGVNNTAQVVSRALDSGRSGAGAFSEGLGYAAGTLVGYTPVAESITGADTASGEQLSTSERWSRGLQGGSQLILTGVALGESYNPNLQTGKLAPRGSPTPASPEGGTAYRVMSEEELKGAELGKWENSPGRPTEAGQKWVWKTKEQAAEWKALMEKGGEKPVITE